MKVSIWWIIVAIYAGLFGGIFVTCMCIHFKRSGETDHHEEG